MFLLLGGKVKPIEKTSLDKLKDKTALVNALDLITQLRLLKYVR